MQRSSGKLALQLPSANQRGHGWAANMSHVSVNALNMQLRGKVEVVGGQAFVGEEGWGRGGELPKGGGGWRFAQKCVDFILIEFVLGCQVISPGGVKHNSFYLLLLWLTSRCDLDIKDTDNKGKFPKTSGRSTDSAGVKNLSDKQESGQNWVRLTQPDVC